jgi:hypothetical protein
MEQDIISQSHLLPFAHTKNAVSSTATESKQLHTAVK